MSIHEIKNKTPIPLPFAETKKTLACKLTSSELKTRKATVIKSLKDKLVKKQELHNGFEYKFRGTDEVIDELTEFVKSERSCCGFFDFHLVEGDEGKDILLQITGPEGVKDFITLEMEL